jgi:PKD repeat protein
MTVMIAIPGILTLGGVGLPGATNRVQVESPTAATALGPSEAKSSELASLNASEVGVSNWTNITSNGPAPSPRYGAAMAYYPPAGYVVLFGGFGPGGNTDPLNDTWIFQGGVWTNITSSLTESPAARGWASLTYDQAIQDLVLTQGAYCDPQTGVNCSLPWAFANGSWAPLPPIPSSVTNLCDSYYGATSVYDSYAGYLLSIPWLLSSDASGCALADQGGEWTDLNYNASSNVTTYGPNFWAPALVNDPASDGVLLFGGFQPPDSGEPTNYTWLFANGTWTNLTGSLLTSPPPGIPYGGASYNPADNLQVVFVGLASKYSLVYNQTWEYSNGWSLLKSNVSPSPRASPSLCWDGANNGTLLFGGVSYPGGQPYNSTWILTSTTPLPGATISAYPNPVDAGVPASFSASVWGGTPAYSYSWEFGNGASSNMSNPENTYNSPGNYSVNLTVSDASSMMWHATLSVAVFAPPLVTIRSSANPADANEAIGFNPEISGGTATFTAGWQFGDSSYSTSHAPRHSYSNAGNFTVLLWLNDSGGSRIMVSLVEVVNSAMTTPIITAGPLPVIIGQATNFSVSISGGTPAYSISWQFGDGGTAGNLRNVSHAYSTNGPFQVRVSVSDMANSTVFAFVNLSVSFDVSIEASATAGAAPLQVSFGSLVVGGVPGYTYVWNFGDGFTSAVSSPWHTFSTTGYYDVLLNVTDAEEQSTHASWLVFVAAGGGPLKVSISASPVSAVLDRPSLISASISGGVGIYSLRWATGTLICVNSGLLLESCTASMAGTYNVALAVTDSENLSVDSSTTITVVSSGTVPGGSGTSWTDDWGVDLGVLGGVAAAVAILVMVASRVPRPEDNPDNRYRSFRIARSSAGTGTGIPEPVSAPSPEYSTGTPPSGPRQSKDSWDELV